MELQNCITSGALLDMLNHVVAMNHIRPLSLCTTIYNVITKILAYKLQPLLQQIIRPTQTSFVQGQQIKDNILMAQEVLHKYSKSRGNMGFLA